MFGPYAKILDLFFYTTLFPWRLLEMDKINEILKWIKPVKLCALILGKYELLVFERSCVGSDLAGYFFIFSC